MPDPDRIAARLDALWEIAHGPAGGADRPAFSSAEARAMALVAGWARELSLAPALDPHGNLWALPAGEARVVTSGSHLDTVPDGGRYDGALGTVLGLELIADLGQCPGAPPAGLLVCVAEEAPRFGAGTIGSRLLTGALSDAELDALHDAAGTSARAARADYLEALGDLPRLTAAPTERLIAHAEIHVALRFGPPEIGVVTRVASPRRLEVRITGEPGHAGEVAMSERHDALAAAAEVVLAVERAARAEPAPTVATVGTLGVSPGAVSVIPGDAILEIDIRATDGDALDRVERAIRDAVSHIAAARDVTADTSLTRAGSPVEMDPALVERTLECAREQGIVAAPTWSGAGHDAQHLNAVAPALLVFVPLHGGQSHTPQEGAEIEEILSAAALVAAVLRTAR